MARSTTWKEIHLTDSHGIHLLLASIRTPEYQRYTTIISEGVGIIETNMPWSLFRNWLRFADVKMPRDVLTGDKPSWELYPDED